MKTNNTKKIIVSTLSIAMGAALVGSISGSVAWYQYSTRASASMIGTAAGTSRNLLVSTTGAENTFFNYVDGISGTLKPVRAIHKTTVTDGLSDLSAASVSTTDGKNEIKFFDKPVYQYANSGVEMTVADAITNGYLLQQDLYFKVSDAVDGAAAVAQSGKAVYLQELQVRSSSGMDLTNAIRVNIGYGETGGDLSGATLGKVETISQSGRLDIGGAASVMDTDSISVNDKGGRPVFYNTLSTATEESGTKYATAADVPNTVAKNDVIEVVGSYVYNKTEHKWEAGTTDPGTATHVPNYAALEALNQKQIAAEAAVPAKPDVLADGAKYIVDDEATKTKITEVRSQKAALLSEKGTGKFIVDDSDPYNFVGGQSLGTTTAAEKHTADYDMLKVTLTIWLEGWGLNSSGSASWDYATYADSQVSIIARFATQAE